MKDRRRGPSISHDRWLVSYADFVTLLFAFFVVLYATSQVDKQKAVRLSDAIQSAFTELGVFQNGGPNAVSASGPPSADAAVSQRSTPLSAPENAARQQELTAIRKELERALAPEIKQNNVALHMDADGLVVSLREMGFFDSGSANIKPEAENAVSRVALILREHACFVRIEGHTDNVPIHTAQFASNWELSTARATGLVKALIEQHDISPERLSAAGYAEFHPVSSNDSVKGRQLNRRVDVVILRAGRSTAPPSSSTTAVAHIEPTLGP
ncbi:MAG TPA: flagellar motor protein MotB [Terriglobales bacterium]|jgi:chemotaxis protein MotB